MNRRMAGQLAAILSLGGGAAIAADALAHDEMDELAQGYKDFSRRFDQSPDLVQTAYSEVFGAGPMSNMDRMIATGILNGTIPPSQGDGPIKSDSPAGGKAIKLAEQIRQKEPELSRVLADLARQEIVLFGKEALHGVSSADVVSAAEQGAGHSMIPALVAGAGVGGAVALHGAAARRMNR